MRPSKEISALVAGIGGASLGTEILKALHLAGHYRIFGCDISPLAFGHSAEVFVDTFVVDRGTYVTSVLDGWPRTGVRYSSFRSR